MHGMRKTIILLYLVTLGNTINLEYDGWAAITLQHALEDTEVPLFVDRGNITIQSLRTGSYIVNQAPLSSTDKLKIAEMASKNQFYQVKLIVTASDGTSATFYTSIKACMLVQAELNDILSLSLDYSGQVVTTTLAIASTSTCEGVVILPNSLKEFSTSVHVRYTEHGPSPDTASYIQKLEREREAKEKGEVKDNRSFLAKYWMYIVPVIVIMVLSSAANPESGGGGGGSH